MAADLVLERWNRRLTRWSPMVPSSQNNSVILWMIGSQQRDREAWVWHSKVFYWETGKRNWKETLRNENTKSERRKIRDNHNILVFIPFQWLCLIFCDALLLMIKLIWFQKLLLAVKWLSTYFTIRAKFLAKSRSYLELHILV